MKKLFAFAVLFFAILSVKSQTIVFTGGCWDPVNGKYKFSFVESGEGQSPTDTVTYTTNFNTETRVLATKDGSGTYSVIVPKANNSPSQRWTINVYVNGKYVSQKQDDTNTCPMSLPLKYKTGSFQLVGRPKLTDQK
jgi:hypothetical protein